jgi:hypothetical protein
MHSHTLMQVLVSALAVFGAVVLVGCVWALGMAIYLDWRRWQ